MNPDKPAGLVEPCFYCGEPCEPYAGDPGRWPLGFSQADGTGICRWHHAQCVVERLPPAPVPNDTSPTRGKEMNELIERLEKAMRPDRECDFLIFELIAFPTEFFGSKIESWSRSGGAGYTANTADGIRHLSAFNAPHFTASIDAALTLLPDEDHHWKAGYSKHVRHNAEVRDLMHPHKGVFIGEHGRSRAIALCIAALKARAALIPNDTAPHERGRK